MPKRTVWGLLITATFFSSSGYAATYYVRTDGDDSADGRSHQTAWASIGKINSFSFNAGDVVLLHEGHTWKKQKLVVDWGGTSDAHAVVGAYYVENGKPVRGFKTSRPTLDGQDAFPSSRYDSLVHVSSHRVRVENLALVNSEGRGITFDQVNYGQAVGLLTRNTYDCGIAFTKTNDSLIENNHVIESDRARPEDKLGWCAGIANVKSNRNVIRRNIVERSHGEGINTNYGSTDTIIEDNVVFAVRAVGIYADSAPSTTIRRNIVLGTKDSQYWRGATAVGSGIVLNNEAYSHVEGGGSLDSSVQTTGARVYGNLVAYASAGISVWGDLAGSSFKNTVIVNNTLVDNGVQFGHYGKPMPNSVFANNILLSLSDGAADVKRADVSGLTTRNNYYSQGDPGGMYSHSANRYAGLQLAKMSGWRSIDDYQDVSASDFAPLKASSTNGAGDESHFALATSKDAFQLDFNGNPHNKPIDLGGIRYGETAAVKTPKGPRLIEARAQ